MPYHADLPHFVLRMQEANRLFQFAMRRPYDEYYDAIERPDIFSLVDAAGKFTSAEYSHHYDEESSAIDLFMSGIQDIIPPFATIASSYPEINQDKALGIMAHPETISTYGLLASMPQTGLLRVNHAADEHFTLSEDHTAITLKQSVRSSPSYGCEAVHVHDGRPEMTQTFKKFVTWAGSLATIAYFKYDEL